MITPNEARNTIAAKNGHKDWQTARYRMGADDLDELMIEAMEYYAEQSNSHKPVVVRGGDKDDNLSTVERSMLTTPIAKETLNTPTEPLPAEGEEKPCADGHWFATEYMG